MKTNLDAISEILFGDIFQILVATLTYSSRNFSKVFIDIYTGKTDFDKNKKTILTSPVLRMEN